MSMTMSQKILAHHAGLEEVRSGQLIMANLDLVLGNDITSPVAINEFKKFGIDQVFDKSKVALVPDHFAKDLLMQETLLLELTHTHVPTEPLVYFQQE
jgi:3-isopropylmalate/(R)-2-methylmalate dehydratase large subunit